MTKLQQLIEEYGTIRITKNYNPDNSPDWTPNDLAAVVFANNKKLIVKDSLEELLDELLIEIKTAKSGRHDLLVSGKFAENSKVPIKVYENYNHLKTIALNGFRIYGLEPQLNSKEIVSGTVRVDDVLTALKQ